MDAPQEQGVVGDQQVGTALPGLLDHGEGGVDREGIVRWSLVNPIGEARDFSGYHEALKQLA